LLLLASSLPSIDQFLLRRESGVIFQKAAEGSFGSSITKQPAIDVSVAKDFKMRPLDILFQFGVTS